MFSHCALLLLGISTLMMDPVDSLDLSSFILNNAYGMEDIYLRARSDKTVFLPAFLDL